MKPLPDETYWAAKRMQMLKEDAEHDKLLRILGSKSVPDITVTELKRESDRAAFASALDTQVQGTHYKDMPIQPAEFCHANGIPFIEGCCIKYLCRHRAKNGIADLEKAKHFIEILIELETRKLSITPNTPQSIRCHRSPGCSTQSPSKVTSQRAAFTNARTTTMGRKARCSSALYTNIIRQHDAKVLRQVVADWKDGGFILPIPTTHLITLAIELEKPQ